MRDWVAPPKQVQRRTAAWRDFVSGCGELEITKLIRLGRGNLAMVGGPGVKPGFAASDATVLFSYTTHPSGTRAGNPTRISSLGPKRHHALDHASETKTGRDAEN
jgi:hypothetical protein